MKKLEITIDKLLKEYTGTGASGGNAGDGNNMVSPRPYDSDKEEVQKAYTDKNVYGAEGGHYKKEPAFHNPNRQKMGMFELKDFIKKIVQEIEVEEQAYTHATLTTQGQSIYRAPGVWEEELQEQLTPDEMKGFNNKKTHHQKAIAQIDIDMAEESRKAISVALQQQTSQMGPQLSQIDQQIYGANVSIKDKKNQLRQLRTQLEELNEKFDNTNIEDEELRIKLLEDIDVLEGQIDTTKEEISGLNDQRGQLNQQRDQLLAAKSQSSAAASTQMKQADAAIRDQRKAMNQIGKEQMQENVYKQYMKERANINLMEQMDSYTENTRGSLQKFFEMFEDGKTNEEVLQYYAKEGIKIPESYIGKTKKAFEQYKKMKLDLQFLEQEAKDFKKPLELSQELKPKQLTSKLKNIKK